MKKKLNLCLMLRNVRGHLPIEHNEITYLLSNSI